MGEPLSEAIRRHVDSQGRLSCAQAFRVAQEQGVQPLQVGQEADRLGVRLSHCQLGLFGYGPKAEGRHKLVKPASAVDPELAQAIREGVSEGGLPCLAAWEMARIRQISRLELAAAAEALGIKIVRCQLGAF